MERDDFEIVKQETLHKSYFRLDRYWVKYRLFAGGWSETVSHECFERGNGAAVLAYDPKLDKVIITEQFRVGAIPGTDSPWTKGIIAGMIDSDDKSPESTIRRESIEEAGLELLDIKPITQVWTSPGGCSERLSIFCGKVDAANAGGIHGLASEFEDIKVMVWDCAQAFQAVEDGAIRDACAVIALQWLEKHYTSLQKW